MVEVADRTVGAKYQEELVEELLPLLKETAKFYFEVLMQDGYLPGTVPPRTAREGVMLGAPLAIQLTQRRNMGEQLGAREQQFLFGWEEARRKLGDSTNGTTPQT